MADELPEFHDVIVIGAGAAGLRCANQLIHAQGVKDVLVVEASARVGGRVMNNTCFIPGLSIEVGAEFMHGENTTLTRMAEEYHISLREIFTWAQVSTECLEPMHVCTAASINQPLIPEIIFWPSYECKSERQIMFP
ncbi:hypothetical protein PHMEG_000469 [Phytophthora megakarya]|uniref:Amine oxidase domain-containing protein n=1 Tax=Phytophthora megakarya TaxID=4795 RepID=A0A225X3H6_9STRA|nr:hypothetical protein PHMEG_000469 [Phytophthora megakarya]